MDVKNENKKKKKIRSSKVARDILAFIKMHVQLIARFHGWKMLKINCHEWSHGQYNQMLNSLNYYHFMNSETLNGPARPKWKSNEKENNSNFNIVLKCFTNVL